MKKFKTLVSTASVLGATLISSGAVFAASTTSSESNANTPITTTLQAPSNPTNPTPPQPDGAGQSGNSNNANNNVSGTFGIAYQPKSFSFETNDLKSTGAQSITATNPHNAPYNVGVKDMTHDNKGWTLTAKLTWKGNAIPGATIGTTNANGTVNKNINKGNGSNFNSSSDLVPATGVIGTHNLSINTSATKVMEGVAGEIHNAVYDYALGTVTLDIPDTSTVVAGTYSGNVNWNLQVTP
ncbi:TPA: WxL domain-containing protein [Enterococcus hirae]|uniref:WxL domain-containing protein n=1 Tax=Enterococcus hirae TaxID=1354 RepID=UPI0027C217BD|nr:WxL domain-containing protein [Enterococcus hirae]MDQ2183099.1 WxL domain-containing protein [Enterococcus hirae]